MADALADTTQWSNWSGSVSAQPAEIARPKTQAELSAIVARAKKVRVAGAGHSFMPLCETDGTLLSLADLEGDVEIVSGGGSVIAPAGWSLAKLTDVLWQKGLSLGNQGDVNPQALAGALATGTHGTGATLGSLSTFARGFTLTMADGSIISCSKSTRPELFEAQRLSLGLFGVATRIEIEVLPAFHLEERIETHPLDEIEQRWSELAADNRHVEFFVFPYGDNVVLKVLNLAEPEGPMRETADIDDKQFRQLCDLCATFPVLTARLQKMIVRPGRKRRRVGPAWRIFPSERTVKFEEMEYELPRANGWPALREVITWIRRKRLPITFPFEFRLVAADDIWMSPFNGVIGSSISMHQYHKMKWRTSFAEAEQIFLAHGGRPHWAKRHTLKTDDVHRLYPKAKDFLAVRSAVDPGAKFANAHLSTLFGVQ